MRSGREVLRTSSQFPVLGSQLKPLASAFLLGTENRELRTRISVIRSFHEPAAAQQVVYEAVEGDGFSVSQGEIPFVARPGFAFPQSPAKRQGPAFQRTSPCTSFCRQTRCTGWPFSRVTLARSGGRKRRRAVTAEFISEESGVLFCGDLCATSATKRRMRNPSGW